MSATDTAGEAAMLPRMVQMVMRIVAAGIVAHPFPTAMYVGSIGMSSFVVEVAMFPGLASRTSSSLWVARN
jgi:hypothetical protein